MKPGALDRLRQAGGWAVLMVAAFNCAAVDADIVIDGVLDEPEWIEAHLYDEFVVTEPFRLSVPKNGLRTQARLFSTPEGIAVGFKLEQSSEFRRVRPRLERDQEDPVDSVNFVIDFDGDARTAYSFTVGLSGSIMDGVASNENELNLDWDTAWTWAVSESESGWQAEMLIPWTVAPMRGVDSPRRIVAVYFSRTLGSSGERQAFPAVSRTRGRFISGFEDVELPQYRSSLFHYWPYVTANHDLIEGETRYKGGVDLFWKPSPTFQLSATLNPDFGQVESDDLVINFDAVETFFTDKRPFFTENQGIFDLSTPDSGRLIHTRRIGGDADDGSGISDIAAAVKLNGSFGALGYGVLAATEDGEAGRDFHAMRLLYPISNAFSIGWLSTDTERPYLDRNAQVQAFDLSWNRNDRLTVKAQVLGSFIDQGGKEVDGSGAWVRLNWLPSDSWSYELEATHFSNQLDFNDLGFQTRPSLNEVEMTGTFTQRLHDEHARLGSIRWSMELQARANDHGDRLPTYLLLGSSFSFRSGDLVYFLGSLISEGWDDLISRGNGLWRQSGRYDAEVGFVSARYGDWTFGVTATLEPQGLSTTPARVLELTANWYPSDSFNVALELGPEWTEDWLIWEGDRDFGRYSRRVDHVSVSLGWFPGLKHEIRLKSEWLAIRAEDGLRYQLQPSGQMSATAQVRPDFDINNFGLQLRYRYVLGPQSDIFLAYSRGGLHRADRDEAGTGDLFEEALELRNADQVLAKVRYRF